MNVFFTADEHYGHGQVIAYCQRPFASLEEMDEALIERHNALVKKKDLVYTWEILPFVTMSRT